MTPEQQAAILRYGNNTLKFQQIAERRKQKLDEAIRTNTIEQFANQLITNKNNQL